MEAVCSVWQSLPKETRLQLLTVEISDLRKRAAELDELDKVEGVASLQCALSQFLFSLRLGGTGSRWLSAQQLAAFYNVADFRALIKGQCISEDLSQYLIPDDVRLPAEAAMVERLETLASGARQQLSGGSVGGSDLISEPHQQQNAAAVQLALTTLLVGLAKEPAALQEHLTAPSWDVVKASGLSGTEGPEALAAALLTPGKLPLETVHAALERVLRRIDACVTRESTVQAGNRCLWRLAGDGQSLAIDADWAKQLEAAAGDERRAQRLDMGAQSSGDAPQEVLGSLVSALEELQAYDLYCRRVRQYLPILEQSHKRLEELSGRYHKLPLTENAGEQVGAWDEQALPDGLVRPVLEIEYSTHAASMWFNKVGDSRRARLLQTLLTQAGYYLCAMPEKVQELAPEAQALHEALRSGEELYANKVWRLGFLVQAVRDLNGADGSSAWLSLYPTPEPISEPEGRSHDGAQAVDDATAPPEAGVQALNLREAGARGEIGRRGLQDAAAGGGAEQDVQNPAFGEQTGDRRIQEAEAGSGSTEEAESTIQAGVEESRAQEAAVRRREVLGIVHNKLRWWSPSPQMPTEMWWHGLLTQELEWAEQHREACQVVVRRLELALLHACLDPIAARVTERLILPVIHQRSEGKLL